MNPSHVPAVGHWGNVLSSRFKRPSSAEIEFLRVGSADAATTQRKREL